MRTAAPARPSQPTGLVLARVNAILAYCTAINAFCLGMICAFCWANRRQPSHSLISQAAGCTSVAEVAEIWRNAANLDPKEEDDDAA